MSPPVKAPPEPEVEKASTERDQAPAPFDPTVGRAVTGPQAAVIAAQHTAGNAAVAGVLGAPTGIQRAPNDGEPGRTSGMAHAPTLDSSSGVATAGTIPGTQPEDPRRSSMAHGPTLDSSGDVGTGPTLPGYAPGGGSGPDGPAGDIGPAGTPLKGPATIAPQPSIVEGGGGSAARPRVQTRGPSYGLTDKSIADAHQKAPGSVHRAINFTWYNWMLDQQKFQGDEFPRGIRVGNAIVIAPDYDGPGPPPRTTTIEEPDEARKLGPDDPVPGNPRLAQGPRQQKPDLSDPNAKRAIFPGSRRGAEPGMKAAVPLTHDEVMRAYRQNPGSVHPSDTDSWHDQVFAIDRGQGQAPRAYRSGNTVIIDPSYPLDGKPPDASPRGSVKQPGPGWDPGTVLNPVKIPPDPKEKARILRDPVEGPRLKQAIDARNERDRQTHLSDARTATTALADAKKAAAPAPAGPGPAPAPPDPTKATQTISPTGYVPQEAKPAKWDVKSGAISRESTQEETRTTDQGTDTKTKSSKKSYSLAKGAGQEWQQREESQTGGSLKAKERSTKLNASLAGVALNRGSTTETGTTPDGPRTKTEKNAGLTLGSDGAGGNASTAITSQSGTKAEAKADVKLGPDSIELTGTGTITTQKGFTGYMSISGKSRVVASEPKKLNNGTFAVSFTMTDENGVELGGGWSKPGGGGPSVALDVGSSTSTSDYEIRVFDTEAEARIFQLTAAVRVSGEKDSIKKATTANGALAMKEGEVRGTSQTDTDTIGGSAGMSQVSVSVASTDATTTGLKIERMAGSKIRVTPSIAEQKALNASISVAGKAGNTKGESETDSFSVTYEFDLGTDGGKRAFETYCKQRLPPPMPPDTKWIDTTTGHAFEDHDVYKFAHVGEIGWGSHATQQTVVNEGGTHTTAVGGQSEKVELNGLRKLTFDKNRHAEADIVGRMDNGQISKIAGQLTVGGEDGSFNRDQFRKIFSDKGAPAGTEVKSSGEWTLSADIDRKMFEDLERSNDKMLKAATREERLKIYSEMAQAGGAQMLSGQVRASGRKLAWNLELKGDPNFPGAAGRQLLNAQRAKLVAQLKARPDSAGSVAAEAKDTLGALTKRLKDVSNKSKYTDLPDELRTEQEAVINTHIAEFKSTRSQALSVQMRGGRKEDLTVVLRRAADEHGYEDVKIEDRAWRNAQDLVTIHETEVSILQGEIAGTRSVVQRMFGGTGDVRWGQGVNIQVFQSHNESAKRQFAQFRSMAPRLTEAVGKMRDQKEKWSAEHDPKARENLLREYDAYVMSAIQIMDVQLTALRDAAKDAYVVTSRAAVDNPAAARVWETIKGDTVARSNASAGLNDDGSVID